LAESAPGVSAIAAVIFWEFLREVCASSARADVTD
jgi:hypothetical protein